MIPGQPNFIIRNREGKYLRCFIRDGFKCREFTADHRTKATVFDKLTAQWLASEYKDSGAVLEDTREAAK